MKDTLTKKTRLSKKKAKRLDWFKFWTFVICLVLSMMVTGFIVFAHNIARQMPPDPVPKADGIVVLTGKGGGRLTTGAKLLSGGYGERLLVSGVNQDLDRNNVLAVIDLPEELAACCVDIDYAQDTIENAQETASWAEALAFEHIILVTSAYHMPRAQVEISSASGRIKITPYPVVTDDSKAWWRDRKTFRRLTQEYGKLLLSYVREPSDRRTRQAPLLDPEIPDPKVDIPSKEKTPQ